MKIKWYNLTCYAECSERTGHRTQPSPDLTSVCCQEVYDIAWEAEKEMFKIWNEWGKAGRNPHYWEFSAIYENRKIESPFLECPGLREVVFKTNKKIIAFYQEHLKRNPEENELVGAYQNCQIDPDFHFDYSLQHGTEEYSKKNYDDRGRKDGFDFAEKVEIAKCVLCGKPVFTYNEDENLDGAGDIKMGFGYGSGRDTNYGKGYIHDNCSGILDQTIFKVRLDWSYPNPIVLKSENQQ